RRHTRWPRDWSSDVCSSDLDWVTDNVPISWTAGETKIITVTATNDGGRVWPATGVNPVRLGYKWVSNATGNTFPGANKSPLAVRSEERRVGKECRCRGGL